ncbi:MAG: type II secretion system F family protein [Actinomycetes bacterium]
MLVLVSSVLAGGAIFFTMQWLQSHKGLSALSATERRRAEIVAARMAESKIGLRERIRLEFARLGLGEDRFPLYAAATVLYLAVSAPLSLLGVPLVAGLLVAIPVSLGAAWGIVAVLARRRRAAFNRQLVDLFDLLVAQIKGGVGAQRGLAMVIPQQASPLREEMGRALAAGSAGGDLVAAMTLLAERYPSRAFTMFLAALEMDRSQGAAIAPAIEQAGDLLKKEFELATEARSKLAQVKYEFYAVAAIVAGIGAYLVLGSGATFHKAYFSPTGAIVLLILGANCATGFFRFHRRIAKLTGDAK